MEQKDTYALFVRRVLLVIFLILVAFFLFKLFFELLLPFTAAFLASLLLSPLSKRLGKKTGLPHRPLRLVLLFLTVGALAFLFIMGTVYLLREAKDFFLSFYESFDSLMSSLFSLIDRLKEKLDIPSDSTDYLSELITSGVQNAMAELSAKSAAFAAKVAGKLPSMLFALLLFLLSLFYFSFDYDKVTAYVFSLIPPRYRPKAEKLKKSFFTALSRYLRAYSLLFLITFAELFLSFLLLRVEHAALLALTAATLDILPAVGVGILLIPWAIGLLIGGNTKKALILLVIYLAVTLIRQVIEPYILGSHLGIHPIASLIALYLGFRLFGVLGILLSPFLALIATHIFARYRHSLDSSPGEKPP